MAIEKIKILWAVLELPAKQHCQFWPIWPNFEVNGLDWQCCLADSSKMAPRILIFSIAMGAYYSFEVKNIEIWVPAFFRHNNSSVGSVSIVCSMWNCVFKRSKVGGTLILVTHNRNFYIFPRIRSLKIEVKINEANVQGRKQLSPVLSGEFWVSQAKQDLVKKIFLIFPTGLQVHLEDMFWL